MSELFKFLKINIPLLILLLTIFTALAFIKSDLIYKLKTNQDAYVDTYEGQKYKIHVGKIRVVRGSEDKPIRARLIKVSFPFSESANGCEFTYGAAIYKYSGSKQRKTYYEINNPRYLFKFKYDLKNERCESKDLSIALDDLPDDIKVQFIKVRVTEETVEEVPEKEGLSLRFKASDILAPPRIAVVDINPAEPFLSRNFTKRNLKFSANPEYSIVNAPLEDLKSVITKEFRQRIIKCKEKRICDSIQIAVSRIDDPEILRLIDEASRIGIKIEYIVSPFPRKRGQLGRDHESFLKSEVAPWMWLRGNSLIEPDGAILPMHTKFIIFGNDTVISSNTSYGFDWFYRSRELGIVYKSDEIASIFKEIFTMVRTSVFYPLLVDLNDPVMILINAERKPGYAVSTRRSYVEIKTNEGVKSSAYGILFHLMNKTPGNVELVMSPLVNGCAEYRSALCFYDILAGRAENNQLKLWLNSYFYLHRNLLNKGNSIFWDEQALNSKFFLQPKYEDLRNAVSPDESAINLMIMPQETTSNHHQRMALIGESLVIGGSANFAKSSTLNTIEVLNNPALNKKLRTETTLFSEPYYAIKRTKQAIDRPHFKDCEFVLERQARRPLDIKLKKFAGELIRSELSKIDPEFAESKDLKTVYPSNLKEMFSSKKSFSSPEYNISDLQEEVFAPASSICIYSPSKNRTEVLQLRPAY